MEEGARAQRRHIVALLALTLTSCAYHGPSPQLPAAPGPHLVALSAADCRTLLRDDAPTESLQQALARSIDFLQKLPADRTLAALDRRIGVAELVAMLNQIKDAPNADGVCGRFQVYKVQPSDPLLVTGYYEPELPASRTRTERFRYPLYRTPADLVDVDLTPFCPTCAGRVTQGRVVDGKLVPYYSRDEIDAGVLSSRDLELAWLDDPVEAFFLHVQGSAMLRFDDGVHMQISYASANGRPYTSIGRVLVEQGKMARDAVSLQTLKDHLRAHPDEQAALMAANQRYIFFRTVAAGPIGSLGVSLTAGRSVAADAGIYPSGGLAFLRIAQRDRPLQNATAPMVQRFMFVQDAGTAITGPSRLDVFWGTGATAEAIAGDMRNPGELYLVLPQ